METKKIKKNYRGPKLSLKNHKQKLKEKEKEKKKN